MNKSSRSSFLGLVFLVAFSCFAYGQGEGGSLYPQFYEQSCPQVEQIVRSVVEQAVAREARMAASLLRLSFHDCFVQGCDASILLDSRGSIVSEKGSNPNRNSARGFDVIDEIKSAVERECPGVVSCADILLLASRDSVVSAGGPYWELPLGRRDSLTASLSGSNNDIPAPNNTFDTILNKFQRQGLDLIDLVALSGGHTIGFSRCTSFKQRLYNQNNDGKPDPTLNAAYADHLKGTCPRSGGDQNLFSLDYVTPAHFDNAYYRNILNSEGLLSSDQVLLNKSQQAAELVRLYAYDKSVFFDHFSRSMLKMHMISPLTGSQGQIRNNCRIVN